MIPLNGMNFSEFEDLPKLEKMIPLTVWHDIQQFGHKFKMKTSRPMNGLTLCDIDCRYFWQVTNWLNVSSTTLHRCCKDFIIVL